MKSTKLIATFGLAIGLCGGIASRANAQCGVSLKHNQPLFTNGANAANALPLMTAKPRVGEDEIADSPTIVGLWDVKFIADNQVVDEGFDQYHSDGTEILNDTPPPAAGNVCLGVYENTGPRTLSLKHPSWLYDPTNTFVIGRVTILERITLDRGGRSFTGTFTVQFRDLSGNTFAPDLTGQLKADRITPD